jgi:hypothetical protein
MTARIIFFLCTLALSTLFCVKKSCYINIFFFPYFLLRQKKTKKGRFAQGHDAFNVLAFQNNQLILFYNASPMRHQLKKAAIDALHR